MKKHYTFFLLFLLISTFTHVNAETFHVCDCCSGSDTACVQGQDDFNGQALQQQLSNTRLEFNPHHF